MNVKNQIKQKVIAFSQSAEDFFHHLRDRLEAPDKSKHRSDTSNESSKPSEQGQIRTYYNTSKEERKLQ